METQTKQTLDNQSRRYLPLSLIASGLIIMIAAAAIFYLKILATLYEKASHSSAAKSVIDQGAYISQWLAEHPFFQGTQASSAGGETSRSARSETSERGEASERAQAEKEDAENFNQTVDWLQQMENGVQYVSISEDGVLLYQRQIGGKTEAGTGRPAPLRRGRMAIGRKKLVIGTNTLPVITFSMVQTMADGHKRVLEVGLSKAVIERQSAGVSLALKRMFYLSLVTIAVAFLACLVAILGFVHREMVWQKRIRLDEHLAFAGAVAGSVIHDFRNPLSAMRLDAQLLQNEVAKGKEGQPEHLAELSRRIVKTIDRIDGLLAEFLTLATPAKPEAWPANPPAWPKSASSGPAVAREWPAKPGNNERETFEVNACVLDCMELLKMRFEKAGVNLVINLADGRLPVSGFPAQFKRALLNIMINAEQFSPPTGRVMVQTSAERKYALIKIADEGPGIPRPERKKIFRIFYSKRPGGTGIGLALARTAVENCGGDITLETPSDGKGACFVIRIPLREG